jgi:hypothetical protein
MTPEVQNVDPHDDRILWGWQGPGAVSVSMTGHGLTEHERNPMRKRWMTLYG